MKRTETITTSAPHDFRPGDIISFELPDRRWWRRLLFWMLRRGTPMRTVYWTVSGK